MLTMFRTQMQLPSKTILINTDLPWQGQLISVGNAHWQTAASRLERTQTYTSGVKFNLNQLHKPLYSHVITYRQQYAALVNTQPETIYKLVRLPSQRPKNIIPQLMTMTHLVLQTRAVMHINDERGTYQSPDGANQPEIHHQPICLTPRSMHYGSFTSRSETRKSTAHFAVYSNKISFSRYSTFRNVKLSSTVPSITPDYAS